MQVHAESVLETAQIRGGRTRKLRQDHDR
jgi:hypothetical protein